MKARSIKSITIDQPATADLDNHADQCILSDKVALITTDWNIPVSVNGFNPRHKSDQMRTVSGIVAYDSPKDGRPWYLHIHQALDVPDSECVLLCSNQLRDIGIRVNDEPKHLVPNPTQYHNAIAIQLGNDELEELIIPMSIKGVTHYFPIRKPTEQEYSLSDKTRHLKLTSDDLIWEPEGRNFEEEEAKTVDVNGELVDPRPSQQRSIFTLARTEMSSSSNSGNPELDLGQAMQNQVELNYSKRKACSLKSTKRDRVIKRHTLAKRWGISTRMAEKTLNATTQRIIRMTSGPDLNRRFRTNDRQLRYRRLPCDMYTDTLKAKMASWHRKNKYAQVFATHFGWCRAYPTQQKSDAHVAFSKLAQTVGVPAVLIMDGAREQTLGAFRKKVRQATCRVKQTEPYSPWQNAAERNIKELKRGSARKQARKGSPKKLWDHSLELEALIRSHTALDHPDLDGQVPETIVTGQTGDISALAEFEWYDWVKYLDPHVSYPDDRQVYGRWLGPALDIGPALTCKILKQNGQVIYTSTYRHLNQREINDSKEMQARRHFDREIHKLLGEPVTEEMLRAKDEDAVTPHFDPFDPDYAYPDIDDATPEFQDSYIGAEVTLPLQGTMVQGKVKKRSRTDNGELFGKSNTNPILDTRSYDVEFPDGNVKSYTANVIAENMVAQCDPLGNQYRLMESIIDHKTDSSALSPEQATFEHQGRKHVRRTTKGWFLCVLWKDGSTSWERLADLKESYPVEVAEYATRTEIDDQPAFSWWTRRVLKKRDRIIAAVNKRYHKRTHKFGIEVPKTVQRALEIDKENGNTFWQDAIEKELSNVRVAFKVVDESEIPKTSQYMECHMVFDVKLEGLEQTGNFRRKARLVAGGHKVSAPNVPTYASVVSRETVRIALTMAALLDLEVKCSDVMNAFLCAPCEEVIHTKLGPEFGPDEGKWAVIVRALYGLKSASASYNRLMADCMWNLGYQCCKADTDLWIKKCIHPKDGRVYYSYVLIYVDDCLAIHHDAETCLKEIDKFFKMKPDSIGDPDIYLGAKLRLVTLCNGRKAWSMSPSKYVQEAVKNVEKHLLNEMKGRKLPAKYRGLWPSEYRPELDDSKELEPEQASFYQSLIGVLHWMVELGRVDMITEVSMLASHLALPREGHLDAALGLFAYLKRKHNSRMVFDPTPPEINLSDFPEYSWTRKYGDIKEAIPVDAPEPLGEGVDLRMYVDADHASDKKSRRSRTGYFIFLNSACIAWLSKKQPTVETSVFGSEFVAMKLGIEALRGIRYKLRMIGIKLNGPSYIYGDNMSVVNNSSKPDSTLNKKSSQICFHAVREAVAMKEALITHIATTDNVADIATKVVPYGQKRIRIVDKLLYDLESLSLENKD